MITRHDLTHEHLHDVLRKKKHDIEEKYIHTMPDSDSVELDNIVAETL